jgi:hypothetical protein
MCTQKMRWFLLACLSTPTCKFLQFVSEGVPFISQANILAKYKPRLNTTTLLWSLKQADDYTRKALENLKSVRHITLYYEDLIQNRTVSYS